MRACSTSARTKRTRATCAPCSSASARGVRRSRPGRLARTRHGHLRRRFPGPALLRPRGRAARHAAAPRGHAEVHARLRRHPPRAPAREAARLRAPDGSERPRPRPLHAAGGGRAVAAFFAARGKELWLFDGERTLERSPCLEPRGLASTRACAPWAARGERGDEGRGRRARCGQRPSSPCAAAGGRLRASAGSLPASSSSRSKAPSPSRSTPMRRAVPRGTSV